MEEREFIVAIELGSSRITGMAGKKNSDGSISVLAYVSKDSSSFIRKGGIYNLNKTAQCLTLIINLLEEKLQATIAKVYVGIGGQSLRTVKNTVVRHLEKESEITEELVAEINDENVAVPLIDMEILDVVPQEYRIGNTFQIDPVGVLSNHIEGRFLNVIARDSVKKNLKRCFAQAKIEVAEYFILPMVTASVVLSDTEKRSGCALVDLGADTTTVSVYKNNILRHLVVLPIGGNSITGDLCNLQLEKEEAERLKCEYGNALNEQETEEETGRMIKLTNKREVEEKVFNDIVEARAEEIIANVWNQIQVSGYDAQLLAGIVLTGGGTNLKGIEEAFRKKTKMEKVRVVRTVLQGVKAYEPDLLPDDATSNAVLGLLFAGEENCCKPEEVKPINVLLEESSVQEEVEKEEEPVKEEEKTKMPGKPKTKKGWFGFGKIKEAGEEAIGRLFDDEEK